MIAILTMHTVIQTMQTHAEVFLSLVVVSRGIVISIAKLKVILARYIMSPEKLAHVEVSLSPAVVRCGTYISTGETKTIHAMYFVNQLTKTHVEVVLSPFVATSSVKLKVAHAVCTVIPMAQTHLEVSPIPVEVRCGKLISTKAMKLVHDMYTLEVASKRTHLEPFLSQVVVRCELPNDALLKVILALYLVRTTKMTHVVAFSDSGCGAMRGVSQHRRDERDDSHLHRECSDESHCGALRRVHQQCDENDHSHVHCAQEKVPAPKRKPRKKSLQPRLLSWSLPRCRRLIRLRSMMSLRHFV